MAIDFATLTASKATIGSISNWVNRDDIPVVNILTEAQAAIYLYLRCREMLSIRNSFTFLINTDTLALPDDFLDPIQFLPWQYGWSLPFYQTESFKKIRDNTGVLQSGTPACWTIIGVTAHVDVSCNAAFGGDLYYFALPPYLAAGVQTNFLTTRYPSLLRYACMMKAYEHMKKSDVASAYLQGFQQELQTVAMTNDMWLRSSFAPT